MTAHDPDPDDPPARAAASDAELYARCWPAVVDVVARRLGSVEEAEAIAQDALLRALDAARAAAAGGEPVRQFRAFAMRIALNLATDQLRRRDWRAPREDPEHLAAPAPAGEASIRELERLRGAVDALAPEHREIVELRYVDGRSFAEIASMLGKSKNGVFARHQRALELLRAAFGRGGTG